MDAMLSNIGAIAAVQLPVSDKSASIAELLALESDPRADWPGR